MTILIECPGETRAEQHDRRRLVVIGNGMYRSHCGDRHHVADSCDGNGCSSVVPKVGKRKMECSIRVSQVLYEQSIKRIARRYEYRGLHTV